MKGSGWRRNARELAPFYGIGGLYIAAKAYYLRHGLATTFPDPRARAYVEAGYRVNLEPRTILDHIGRYCTFTVDLLYNRLQSDAAAVVLGACVLLAAAGMTAAVLTGRWDGRMVRVAAFGLDLFIIGLVPVLVLPAHVYSYYVGIAALGMALAIVSALHALPWCPRLAPWTAVALLLAVHVGDTAVSVRGSEEFRFFRSFSDAAAGWLYALRRHAESPGVQEVVLPETKLTDMVFNLGQAHQLFLCADYRLLTVPDVDAVEPKAGRLILSQPERAPRGSGGHAWGWLQPCRAEP